MTFLRLAALAAACCALLPARAGVGTYNFGQQAYQYGYQGGQLAYAGYLLETNNITQAASGWSYYGFTWANYAVKEPGLVLSSTYFLNAQNSYDQAINLLAAYNAANGAANEKLDAALVHLQIARNFCIYAAYGF